VEAKTRWRSVSDERTLTIDRLAAGNLAPEAGPFYVCPRAVRDVHASNPAGLRGANSWGGGGGLLGYRRLQLGVDERPDVDALTITS